MTEVNPNRDSSSINTGGGTVVTGDVNIPGGTFIGRDLTVTIQEIQSLEDQPPTPGEPPYKGLAFYDKVDEQIFFGRLDQAQKLCEMITTQSFVAVVGGSGSGKSSLVRAAVLPMLIRDGWNTLVLRPNIQPMLELLRALNLAATPSLSVDDLSAYNTQTVLQTIIALAASASAQRLVLVIDQFEEIFTIAKDKSTNTTFVSTLLAAQAYPAISVMIVVRADFYHRLTDFADLPAAVAERQVYLTAMTREQITEVIKMPLQKHGWRIQEGLVEVILDDVGQEPGVLPFLSHALLETWQRRHRNILTLSGYSDTGGVKGAIAATANEMWKDFSRNKLTTAAKAILIDLTELGERDGDQQRTPDTRRRRAYADLTALALPSADLDSVLEALVRRRLLTRDHDQIEVAHEALIRAWPLFQGWLDADHTALRLQRQLQTDAQRWQTTRSPDDLYRGARLASAQEWANRQPDPLSGFVNDFLQASLSAEENAHRQERARLQALADEQRARARTFRWAAGISSILLIFALIGSYVAYDRQLAAEASEKLAQQERGNAEAQRLISRSGEVAAVANSRLIAGDSQLALLLGAAALNQITYTPQARAVTQAALEQWRQVATFPGHTDMVTGITFSRNNRYLATASWDDRARVWDLQTNQLLFVVDTHQADVSGAFFSIDNQYLITASRDNTIQTRTIPDGQLIYTLTLDFPVRSLAIHPGGDWFAVRSGNQVWLYDIVTGRVVEKSPYELEGVDVRVLTFTRDGKQILAGANDNLAHIWDIASGQHGSLQIDQGHQHAVTSVQQSSDRRFIASMSDDLLLLWEWANGFQARGLKQAGDGTLFRGQLEFSPDSRYLAAGSASGVIRLWDLSNLEADPYQLIGHTAEVKGIYYSPDGRLLASASRDGTVLLWNLTTRESFTLVTNQNDNGSAPVFSRDGRLIATGDSEGTVHLWKVNYGGNIGYYPLLTYPAETAALSADQLVMVGEDGLLEFWRPHNGAVRAHKLSAARLTALASRPTANLLAAGDAQGELFLFDSRADTLLHSWTTQQGRINALLMLPITNTLVTAGSDATLQIWDWQTQQLSNTLAYHNRDVSSLLALPDGSGFLSAGMDGAVVAWSLPKAESRLILQHEEPLISLAVSPSGQIIAAGTTLEHIVVKDITADKTFSILAGTIVHALTFVDDHTLAVGGENGEIQLWDLNARTASKYNAHGNHWIRALAVSEDGRVLYSVGDDGLAKAWLLQNDDIFALACLRAGRSLTPAEWDDYFTFNISTNFCPPASSTLTDTLAELPDPVFTDIEQQRSNLPFILFFDALNGTHVAKGEPVTLRWHAENATAVYLESGDQSEGVPGIGSKAITIDQPTTFRLKVKNWFGVRTMEITITPSS
jgi:WD40 repeat protein